MTRTGISSSLAKAIFPAIIAALLWSGLCFSQISVTVSPKSGPPTTKTSVSGSGFTSGAEINIYFDTTLETSTTADSTGSFSNVAITIPAAATPGKHSVSADEISNGTGAQAPFRVNTNWSMFGFTADGARWNPYENQLSPRTVRKLSLAWSYPRYNGPEFMSCAVVDGVVYAGSIEKKLYALSAASGAKLWSFTTGNSIYSSPAVSDGVVYFGSGDNNVYALSASTGAKLWNFISGGPVYPSPAVADGVVYVGSWDDNIYALSASAGGKLWSFTTGGPIYSSPAVVDGVVYQGSSDGKVYALKATNGEELWSFNTGAAVGNWYGSSTVAVNGVVYVGTSEDDHGSVYALNASTGAELWSTAVVDGGAPGPVVAYGVVYVGGGDNLYALSAATGVQLWDVPIAVAGFFGAPVVANGVVYVSGYVTLYALDAATGATLWSYDTGAVSLGSPAVANGVVFLGNNVAFDAFSLPASEDAAKPRLAGLGEVH
jgi:eukaryotic-like serine/threonine-protein kinase